MEEKGVKKYLVKSKSDNYNACVVEIVETLKIFAEEYYYHKEIDEQDIPILKKYFSIVEWDKEKERNSDRRFYGV